MPNVLSPRDLVSRPDNMDETVPHTLFRICLHEASLGPYLSRECTIMTKVRLCQG